MQHSPSFVSRRLLLKGLATAVGTPTLAPAVAQTAAPQPSPIGLPDALAQALRRAGLAPEHVGLAIAPMRSGAPIAAMNAQEAFNPASTMKVLTTYAALSRIGPDFRWRTTAALRGAVEGDVLRGDLVIRGSGDPKLVVEDLQEWLTSMRRAGLREIRGDLILDDGVFALDGRGNEAIDGDPSQPYNVPPFGVLMNFKAVRLRASATVGGAAIDFDPPLSDVEIQNLTQRGGKRCEGGVGGLVVRDASAGAQAQVRVQGPYSRACGDQSGMVAVLEHRQFVHGLFKAVWSSLGGVFLGTTRIERNAALRLPVWSEWVSPRLLADVVNDVNKFSNNVMARHLMLQLGQAQLGRAATVEESARVLTDWIASLGLRLPELVVENGSGLSRRERISATGMLQVLRHAALSPMADLLRLSLPIVGIDGTMRSRLPELAGQAWIKTGSLNNVRSLAGYVDAASGRRVMLALMINGPRAEGSQAFQDTVLRWAHANG
jgi:D-alanyl-D-alanine carboxypeptidase/D-alanyl-D-alanine-endopeptidase (penicillin-binding protein 4)